MEPGIGLNNPYGLLSNQSILWFCDYTVHKTALTWEAVTQICPWSSSPAAGSLFHAPVFLEQTSLMEVCWDTDCGLLPPGGCSWRKALMEGKWPREWCAFCWIPLSGCFGQAWLMYVARKCCLQDLVSLYMRVDWFEVCILINSKLSFIISQRRMSVSRLKEKLLTPLTSPNSGDKKNSQAVIWFRISRFKKKKQTWNNLSGAEKSWNGRCAEFLPQRNTCFSGALSVWFPEFCSVRSCGASHSCLPGHRGSALLSGFAWSQGSGRQMSWYVT